MSDRPLSQQKTKSRKNLPRLLKKLKEKSTQINEGGSIISNHFVASMIGFETQQELLRQTISHREHSKWKNKGNSDCRSNNKNNQNWNNNTQPIIMMTNSGYRNKRNSNCNAIGFTTIDYLTTPVRSLKNGIRPRGKNEPNKEKCTNC